MEKELSEQQQSQEETEKNECQSQEPEQPPVSENPPHVKQYVDSILLTQLRDEMGFTELRAEKSLYYTKNAGLEAAVQWLADHDQDDSIDTAISITEGLTKEEAQRKAFELQQQLRKHRAEKEKIDEIEKERKRIEMGKNMLETQRAIEEAARKQTIEKLKREKEQHEAEKQRQFELLKKDYEERFGKSYPEEERKKEESDISKKSAKDQCAYWIGRLKTRASDTNKEPLLICIKTVETYIRNAYDNPTEPKYHRIKKDNRVFVSRVMPFSPESLECLNAVGFHDNQEGFLAIDGLPDKYLMSRALNFLNLVAAQLT